VLFFTALSAFEIIEGSAWSFARYGGRLVKLTGDDALI